MASFFSSGNYLPEVYSAEVAISVDGNDCGEIICDLIGESTQ